VKARAGSVDFQGQSLLGMTPEAIVRLGLALVPEGRHILPGMTVLENLQVPIQIRKDRAAAARDLERLLSIFPILKDRLKGVATKLSGGEQQQLAIARALLCAPRMLMVDEPSLGLAPRIVEQVYAILMELNRERGLTLLIVEQSTERAARFSDRYYVMRSGEIVMSGATERDDSSAMRQAYFGYQAEARAT
jgi:branched-chain amino acid transport system ATP-binding protein